MDRYIYPQRCRDRDIVESIEKDEGMERMSESGRLRQRQSERERGRTISGGAEGVRERGGRWMEEEEI